MDNWADGLSRDCKATPNKGVHGSIQFEKPFRTELNHIFDLVQFGCIGVEL